MKPSKPVTLAILIDSFRHDMLGPNTPFLLKLAEQGLTGVLEPPLSYCLYPTWFAGISPETSGKMFNYVYSPKNSPYFRLKFISLLQQNRLLRISSGFARHHLLHELYGFAPFIPDSMFRYFKASEKIPPWSPEYLPETKTLFDTLREHDMNWLFIGSPGSDQRTFAVLAKFYKLVSKSHSFVWLHFAEPDWVSHQYGPNSLILKKVLQNIDRAIELIYKRLTELHLQINSFIFGDHGHVPITHRVNVLEFLNDATLRIGVDYVCFLDSTVARFWFRNNSVCDKVSDLLSTSMYGKFLSLDDINNYGLNLDKSIRGQAMWVANEGVVILPNFWQGNKKIMGMHGYLPGVKDNCSRFIVAGPKVSNRKKLNATRSLMDVFPTLLDLTGLPLPETNEGTNILSKGAF